MKKLWPGLVANVAAGIFGVAMLSRLPQRVASHWGANGEVNGYMPRVALVALIPFLALVMSVVLTFAPTLDPRRRNFPLHAGSYWVVTNAVLVFLAMTHVAILGFNLGWPINISSLIGIGSGLLFIVLGNVLTRVRPNWMFGVRTPWTLSSDLSWRETHRVAGYGFVAAGIAVLIAAALWQKAVIFVLLAAVGSVSIVSVVWSYFAWKRDPAAQKETS